MQVSLLLLVCLQIFVMCLTLCCWAGTQILNGNTLAYFDALCCVAAWNNQIALAEKATNIPAEIADLIEEHNTEEAKLALQSAILQSKNTFYDQQ